MLYWLKHGSYNKYKYAYKDMTLLGYTQSICPQCNRSIGTPQFTTETHHLILEGNGTYPDYLQFCGAGKQMFLVTEQTLNTFETNRITGYTSYQPVITETIQQNSNLGRIPTYYCLNISGRIDLDFDAMHIRKRRMCPRCGQFEWSRMKLDPVVLDLSTWNNADLCLVDSIPGYRVCTEKMKRIIQKNRLSGFSFCESR